METNPLRSLPSVDRMLKSIELKEAARIYSPVFVTEAVRDELVAVRERLIAGEGSAAPTDGEIIEGVMRHMEDMLTQTLAPVVNATGTVLHTNLGRAVLAKAAREAILRAAGAANVEYDLKTGKRGERDARVEELICKLTGAEAACIVNNNAAAVLITLNSLAENREVVISRGELVEIGGSFRLPDIIRKSGCILREVGTTNKTHFEDYTGAIKPIGPLGAATAMILKAHTSNYKVTGFSLGVGIGDLSKVARDANIPLVEDLGSGALVDLSAFIPEANISEPVVADSFRAGVDVVTFSGDKLLGGPQAGIIAGTKHYIDLIRKNPLKRALRVDKLTLAALEATLILYLNPETLTKKLPTLAYLTRSAADIELIAAEATPLIKDRLGDGYEVTVIESESEAGSGSLPTETLPTMSIRITSDTVKPDEIAARFMASTVPIIGRVSKEAFLLDMRTIDDPATVVPN